MSGRTHLCVKGHHTPDRAGLAHFGGTLLFVFGKRVNQGKNLRLEVPVLGDFKNLPTHGGGGGTRGTTNFRARCSSGLCFRATGGQGRTTILVATWPLKSPFYRVFEKGDIFR